MFDSALPTTDLTTWLLLTLGLAAFIYLMTCQKAPRDLPPTPGLALPIFGHFFILNNKNPLEQFKQWRKRLGDVFMLKMGRDNMIVLSGHQVMKEAFIKQGDIFSERQAGGLNSQNNTGILGSSGRNWKEQRSTSLGILREFGMGKNLLADRIAEEVEVYLTEISKHKGKSCDIVPLTNMCVSNVICAIIFGKRFDLEDKMFKKMMTNFRTRVLTNGGNTSVFRLFPVLRPILALLPIDLTGLKTIRRLIKEEAEFTKEIVEGLIKDQATKDQETTPSFVSSYLREMKNKESKSSTNYLDKPNLMRVISNLFLAGSETTSSAITWCFVYITHNPQVGEKIYQEICENVGVDRTPSMQDRPNLKYLQAVILETLRIGNVVPLSLVHKNLEDAYVGGYLIPKGSMVVPNLYSVLMDEETWGDPHNFRPERFLDDNGDVIKNDQFIPFSLGRRVCLGESLARMELFLFLAATFQRFKIMASDPNDLPDTKGNFGVTRPPKPFKVKCVEREHL